MPRPRFRYVHQRDAMHCGVASLAMACALLGRRVDVDCVETLCSPTVQGVSLKAVADAARSLGLKAAPVRADLDCLQASGPGAILHWDQNHFVVLRGVSRSGRRWEIADPAKGVLRLSRREVAKHWCSQPGPDGSGEGLGIALLLEPTDEFRAQAAREREAGCDGARPLPLRFLWGYMRRYRKHFAAIALGLAAACLLQLVLPFLTQAIVDVGIARRAISLIWLILIGELVIVAGRAATDFLRSRLLLHISMRINVAMVSGFFVKLLRLPMAFFDTKLTGDLLQRMADHQRVQSFLTGELLSVMFTLLSFVVFGVVLALYDWLIFAVFLAGSVAYGLWIGAFMRRRRVLDYELFEVQGRSQNKTYQFLTAMQEIKLQGCQQRRRREWEDVQADLFGVQMRTLKLQQGQQAGSIFINEVKNILITVLSATAVIQGHLTLGAMLAIQFIVGQLSSPVEQFMSFLLTMQDVRISLERIGEIHRRPDEDGAAEPKSEAPSGAGISLRGVSFRYNPHDPRRVIDSLSLDVPAGKVTAIVGASGSGKTTLVKLMLGFYAPEQGEIRVGGRDLAAINKQEWRARCGAVMQEGVIFSESIARNIAIDVPAGTISMQKVRQAARTACLDDTVMAMPLRYETKVGADGVGLSQGQKQRILIARAVHRDPDFIFLDEATNSLDADNERRITAGLSRFYRGRTVVVVAHRLSTVRDADNIVVLSAGRIAEQGTHEELTARRGAYYNLIKNQLELGT